MTTWRAFSEGFLGVVERGTTMLQLLRTARTGKGKGRSPGDGDLLGVFWGAGILELFVLQGDSMRTWRSPDSIPDVVHLRSGIEEGLGALGCRPHRAVILLLHPDLQQLQVDVPVAASAPVVRTLIQRSMNQQVPDLGDGFWCDVPLMSEGDRARRWVYAMPGILHHGVFETFRTLGIDLGAMIPFSGLAFLEGGLGSDPGTVVLEAWRLPCGIAVGLRRGASLWMVRSLVLDPEEGPRVARELRQTLGFARQRWDVAAPRIRLRGPARWIASVLESLRSEGVGNEVVGDPDEDGWRRLILRGAIGSNADLASGIPVRGRDASHEGTWGPRMPAVVLVLGVGLSTFMGLEARRTRVAKSRVGGEVEVAVRTLEDLEAWSDQVGRLASLATPWVTVPQGIRISHLPALLGGLVPDELLLSELVLWRSDSIWHLAVSGRVGAVDRVEGGRSAREFVAQLGTDLVVALGVRPIPATPERASLASVSESWAERLDGESARSAPDGDAAFRKEWVLP